jgi:hypothetical protein
VCSPVDQRAGLAALIHSTAQRLALGPVAAFSSWPRDGVPPVRPRAHQLHMIHSDPRLMRGGNRGATLGARERPRQKIAAVATRNGLAGYSFSQSVSWACSFSSASIASASSARWISGFSFTGEKKPRMWANGVRPTWFILLGTAMPAYCS